MNIIAAGQHTVTDQVEDLPEFDTVAGQDALRGIVEDLERTAADEVDVEDLTYYRSMLGAPVVQLADYRAAAPERGLAA